MQAKNHRFDRIATIILSVTVLLGMCAIFPGGYFASDIVKGYILVAGSLASFVFWLIARLMEGSFRIPASKLLGALGIFVLAIFASAICSQSRYLSFSGQGFEQGAALTIGALALMSFLASVLFTSTRRLAIFVAGFFLTYVLIALFQLLHLFYPAVTSFGTLSSTTSSVVGTWVDFAYLSGAALVGFTLVFSFYKTSKRLRFAATVGSILALFFVALVGSKTVFALVGVTEISILTYKILAGRSSESSRFPTTAFLLALAMVFLFLTSSVFGGVLSTKLGAVYAEVHPNLSATLVVAHASLYTHPIVGPGPNTFLGEWIAHRPAAFNQSAYWDTPFTIGASYLLTTAFLSGILGILGVLALLAAFLYECMRQVFRVTPEKQGSTLVFSMMILSAYMLATLGIAAPTVGFTIAAFFSLGLLIAVLQIESRLKVKEIAFLKEYRRGFWAILTIVVLLILALTWLTFATKRFASELYFAKGSHEAMLGNFTVADTRFATAIGLSDLPKYEQARTVLSEQYLDQLLSDNSGATTLTDTKKAQIQNAIAVGTASAQRAVTLDSKNLGSYLVLGDYTRLLAPLKIQNAFTTSESTYKQALTLVPGYPKTYLSLGELYFGANDTTNARSYAKQALALKSNYTDAFFLLAQIDAAAGDTTAELADLQLAAKSDTTDVNALLALGEFQYSQGSYSDAISALERVISVSRTSVEGWYYLAMANAKIGNTSDAAKILTMLHAAYPDNTQVSNALTSLSTPPPAPVVPSVPVKSPAKPATPKQKK